MRLIAPDRPGVGLSSGASGYTVADYPAMVARARRRDGHRALRRLGLFGRWAVRGRVRGEHPAALPRRRSRGGHGTGRSVGEGRGLREDRPPDARARGASPEDRPVDALGDRASHAPQSEVGREEFLQAALGSGPEGRRRSRRPTRDDRAVHARVPAAAAAASSTTTARSANRGVSTSRRSRYRYASSKATPTRWCRRATPKSSCSAFPAPSSCAGPAKATWRRSPMPRRSLTGCDNGDAALTDGSRP